MEENLKRVETYRLFYVDDENHSNTDDCRIIGDFPNMVKVEEILRALDPTKMQLFGIFGDHIGLQDFLHSLFPNAHIQIESLFTNSDQIPGIWAIFNGTIFAFLLISNEDVTLEKRNYFTIIMQRYLQDICRHVLICPSTTFFENFSSKHSFHGTAHGARTYKLVKKDLIEVKLPQKVLLDDKNLLNPLIDEKCRNVLLTNTHHITYYVRKTFQESHLTASNNKFTKLNELLQAQLDLSTLNLRTIFTLCDESRVFVSNRQKGEIEKIITKHVQTYQNTIQHIHHEAKALVQELLGTSKILNTFRRDADKDFDKMLCKTAESWLINSHSSKVTAEECTEFLLSSLQNYSRNKQDSVEIKPQRRVDFISKLKQTDKKNDIHDLKENLIKLILLETQSENQLDVHFDIHRLSYTPQFDNEHHLQLLTVHSSVPIQITFHELNLFINLSEISEPDRLELPRRIEVMACFSTNDHKEEIIIIKRPNIVDKKLSTEYGYTILSHKNGLLRKISDFYLSNIYVAYACNQNSQTLVLYHIDTGQVTRCLINEFGQLSSSSILDLPDRSKKPSGVKSLALTIAQDFLILIDTNSNIYRLDISKETNIRLSLLTKTTNNSTSQINFTADNGEFYETVQTIGEKNPVFFFHSKSSIDIIDQNYYQIYSIKLEHPLELYKMQIFTDYVDTYCVLFNTQSHEVYYIQNLISDTRIERQLSSSNLEKLTQQYIGNRLLDIIKRGEMYFGSTDTTVETQYHLILSPQYSTYSDRIQKYFKDLTLSAQLTIEYDQTNWNCSNTDIRYLINTMRSRIPLQLCTVDAGTLIPLNRGKRDRVDYLSSKSFRIDMKAREISFSYLDDILNEINENIKIVGIIGRQSTGKSYLLNKIFQTRFAVAAGRCTDGIWMSYAFMENTNFIILDCEGLFSDQRTEDEEIKLISFLTAVCDVTILSQDLGFSRFQDRLFAALSQAVDKISKSEKLFKGILLVAVRDISDINVHETFDAAEKKFFDLQSKGKSIFLEQLFSNTYKIQLLHHFENQNFHYEIQDLRQFFIEHVCLHEQLSCRWENGKDLADRLKILLVQLYTNDFLDSDEIQTEMKLIELMEQMKKAWTSFDLNNEENIILNEQIIDKIYKNKQYLIKLDHRILQLEENALDQNFENICEFILKQLCPPTQTKEEINQMRVLVDQLIPEVLSYRRQQIKEWIIQKFHAEFPSANTNIPERKRKFLDSIEQYMLALKLQICLKKCSECDLKCTRNSQHKQETKFLLEKKKEELTRLQTSFKTQTSNNIYDHLQELKKDILSTREKQNDLHKEKSRLINELNYLIEKEKVQRYLNQANSSLDIEQTNIKNLTEIINEIEKKFQILHLTEEDLKDKDGLLVELNQEILHLLNPDQYQNDHLNKLIEKFHQNYKTEEKPKNELLSYEFNEEQNESNEVSHDNTVLSSKMIAEHIDKISNYRSFIEKCLRQIQQELTTGKEHLTHTRDQIIGIEQQLTDAEKRKQDMRGLVKSQKIEYENLVKQLSKRNEEKEMLLKKTAEYDKSTDTKIPSEMQKIQHYIQELQNNLNNDQHPPANNQSLEQRKNLEERKLQYFLLEKVKKESALAVSKKEIQSSNDHLRIKELEEQITKNEQAMIKLLESIDTVQKTIKSIDEEENSKHQIVDELNEAHQLLKNLQSYEEQILSTENRLSNTIKRKNIKEKSLAEMKNEQLDGIEEEEKQLIILTETIDKIQIELNDIKQAKLSILLHKIFNDTQSYTDQQKNQTQYRLDELLTTSKHLNENIKQIGITLSSNESKLNEQEQEIFNLKKNLDEQKAEQDKYINDVQSKNELNQTGMDLFQSLTATENALLATSKRLTDIVEAESLIQNYLSSSSELTLSIEEKRRLTTIQEQLAQQLHTMNSSGLICSYTTTQEYEEQLKKIVQEYDNACLSTKSLEEELSELDVYSHLKEEIVRLEKEAQQNCHCGTDHKCSGVCQICATENETKQNPCMFLAGHYGEHKCDAGHICVNFCQICEIYGLSKNRCHYSYQHINPQHHQCERSHQCPTTCICSDPCVIPLGLEKHDIHRCNKNGCWKQCILSCGHLCAIQDHNHDVKAELVTLIINGERRQMKKHLCDQPHDCKNRCDAPGICKKIYKTRERRWITEFGQAFTYEHIEVDEVRGQCNIKIPAGEVSHDKNINHHCDEQHTCQERCPDCGSFCRNPHGHEGYHRALHGNKDLHIFTSTNPTDQIEIHSNDLEENSVRKYKVGELAKPENCSASCKRRGRSHFHLVECPGGSKCWGRILVNKVKHSNDIYYYGPDKPSEKKYDQFLCSTYWSQNKWLSSVMNDADRRIIDSCNTYCTNHVERDRNGLIVKDSSKGFCTLNAWHDGNHIFECQIDHHALEMYQGIDICFVIDTTSSMGPYFEKVKLTITRIIKENQGLLKKIKSKCDFHFAIVDYRDHPPEADYVYHKCDFTNHTTASNYVKNLISKGGGDPPEAVLDGLDAACELKWRDNVDRLLFHILDAPPHGKLYHTFSSDAWPKGCPCGKTAHHVLQKMKTKKISYYVLHCSDFLNMMIAEFKNYIDVKTLTFDDKITFEDVIAKQVYQQLIDTEMTLKRT